MSFSNLDGFLWLLGCLIPFLIIQRWLHRELLELLLLITRRKGLALGLFSFIFFPGVFIHEISHFLAAILTGVRTGKISLIPQPMQDGRLRLGFVETEASDPFRGAIIGAAPLISGGLIVSFIGFNCLGLASVGDAYRQAGWQVTWQALSTIPDQPDFWLWLYLAFTISSLMLPSTSDRKSWLPVLLVLLLLFSLAILSGGGQWLLENIALWVNQVCWSLAGVFAISLIFHVIFGIPITFLRLGFGWLTNRT